MADMANDSYSNMMDKYLLVSDSNEIGGQYDSKKLKHSELIDLMQDNLYRKKLDIMQQYLTVDQFNTYKQVLEEQLSIYNELYNGIKDKQWQGRFKPVDGQVILIRMQDLDDYNSHVGEDRKKTPIEYLKWYWDIPTDFTVQQISDCMLRGVTEINSKSMSEAERALEIKRPSNVKVGLSEENMPIHMHNSSITIGADIQSLHGGAAQQTAFNEGSTTYDMFYNDSFSTGLDKNEVEGVVDEFTVQDSGSETLFHNNMPKRDLFYAFVVRKNTNA